MNTAINPAVRISSHDTLGELFARLVAAARNGDWLNAMMLGESFAIALDVHLRHEELIEFPRFAATSARARMEVAEFLDEHTQIRRAVGRLLAHATMREFEELAAEQVTTLMRSHDIHESLHFQPWLDAQCRGDALAGRVRGARMEASSLEPAA